jgi:glutathione S-transferase
MHVDYWQDELTKFQWFTGANFTAADIMMSFPPEAAAQRGDARSRPKVAAFLDRIHARPGYKAALERGGHYDFAS